MEKRQKAINDEIKEFNENRKKFSKANKSSEKIIQKTK